MSTKQNNKRGAKAARKPQWQVRQGVSAAVKTAAPKGKTSKKKESLQARRQQAPPTPKTPIQLFETPKQMRADPRIGNNAKNWKIDLATQIKTLVEPVLVPQFEIEDWARGYIMKAVEKGGQALAESPWVPYYAYVYMVQVMRGLIVNDPQLAIYVPHALLAVCRGLRAKTVPCANGEVAYASVTTTYVQPTPTKVIGYTSYGNQWNLGIPDVTQTPINNIFPVLDNSGGAYTDEIGAVSFQRINQILQEDDKNGPARMVLTSSDTVMDNDVSMFAYTRPSPETIGMSTEGPGTGGFAYPLNLEVPIQRPVFACFGSAAPAYSLSNRYGNLHANATGDGTFLGASMLTWFTEEKWRMSRPPKLHPVDFFEFLDVVAKWVVLVQQAYINDELNDFTSSPTNDKIQCPLTLQEVGIILRNVLMTCFKDTQAAVHCIYPATPTGPNDNQFVPFIVGSNTCYLAPNEMALPCPIIENIRSLRWTDAWRRDNDYEVFLPVLGQYEQDDFAEDDYFFTLPDGTTTVPAFRPSSSLFQKKVETKAGVVFKTLAQTPISMIDGDASSGYACINDPESIRKLTSMWGTWLKSSGLYQYSTETGTFGTEKGISVLTSVNMTRIVTLDLLQVEGVVNGLKQDPNVIDKRMVDEKIVGAISSLYSNVNASLDSAQSKLVSVAYEQVQSIWILPSFRTSNALSAQITPVKIQAVQDEPFSQIITNGTRGSNLDTLHQTYASKLVRARDGLPTDWEQLFPSLAAAGRGGILSDVAGAFADMIIPGTGSIVRGIGGAIGL